MGFKMAKIHNQKFGKLITKPVKLSPKITINQLY